MPDYVLNLTKKSEQGSARLLVSVGSSNEWRALTPASWFPANTGKWITGRNATKFRQFSYVILTDSAGHSVAHLPNFPYQIGSKFTAELFDPTAFWQIGIGDIDVEVVSGPPDHKTFKLREAGGGSLSVFVFQGEAVIFEIMDPNTGETAKYAYKGLGISFGVPKLPIPSKLPLPGGSGAGPWNDFDAPGWWTVKDFEGDAMLQAPCNVGLGSSYSYNVFQFVGHVNNNPGYQCEVKPLNTGRTISLPSTGFTSGSMELLVPAVAKPSSLRKGGI